MATVDEHDHPHEHDPAHEHGDHETDAAPNGPAFFDDQAATWDEDPAKVERAAVVADAIAAAVPLGPDTRLLEYGAGTGLVTQALRDHVGPVTLVDTSAGMRAVVQAKIDAGNLPDARVWALDLATEETPDEQFDLIVTVLALHHIADLAPVLAGFATLLAPGGHLCIVDLDQEDGTFHGDGFAGHHGFRRPELADHLASAGFDGTTFHDCHQMVRDSVPYSLFLAVAGTPVPA
ncbi:MAG: methyltransferase domain-containing protein [Acidimicrobiales bacterium]|jgi:predicted TPR repeat methyltransferase|nr:methyltransferase domain-containing protein [Acidimicrobiales bacterium]